MLFDFTWHCSPIPYCVITLPHMPHFIIRCSFCTPLIYEHFGQLILTNFRITRSKLNEILGFAMVHTSAFCCILSYIAFKTCMRTAIFRSLPHLLHVNVPTTRSPSVYASVHIADCPHISHSIVLCSVWFSQNPRTYSVNVRGFFCGIFGFCLHPRNLLFGFAILTLILYIVVQ